MHDSTFFPRGSGFTLGELAAICEAELSEGADRDRRLTGIAALEDASADDLAFFDNSRYQAALAATSAGCVIIAPRHAKLLPQNLSALISRDAQGAFAAAGRALFPDALFPTPIRPGNGVSPRADVDPSATIEEGVTIEAFAIVGADVSIGEETVVGAGASIGRGCKIGRGCRIGPGVTVTHSLIGNRVILHPGVRMGQDGFGYAAGPSGIQKSVQIGRVIVQDVVEIGANTTVDRGGIRDTVIGEGTKIDNQVQIAHNVRIGRHCIIVSQVGISGSVTIGDGVLVGGQSGFNGHVTVGDGAQIAAVSSVAKDVPAGARWGGTPAKPVREWFREVTMLSELARQRRSAGSADE